MTPEEQFAAASVGIPDYDPDAIFPRRVLYTGPHTTVLAL